MSVSASFDSTVWNLNAGYSGIRATAAIAFTKIVSSFKALNLIEELLGLFTLIAFSRRRVSLQEDHSQSNSVFDRDPVV